MPIRASMWLLLGVAALVLSMLLIVVPGFVGVEESGDVALVSGVFGKEATLVSPAVRSRESAVSVEVSNPSVAPGTPVVDSGARSVGVSEDWLGRVKAQIEREEYNTSVNERGLQAPNRAHNLRTYFQDGGIEVVPRTEQAADSWSFSWHTLGWGREGRLMDVTGVPAEPRASGSRVRYSREGLEEWYENKKEGLEQGFTVTARPEGESLLYIQGNIGGGLRAELRSDDGAIDFTDGNGARVLRYAELHVRDADGREVPSYLKLDGDRIAILIDDVGAEYPLAIDPLMASPSWAAESNQDGDCFGLSVSTAGDVNGDGYSDVIVGAPYYDNGETNEGRAYVYYGSVSGLAVSAGWTAESNQADAWFGSSVSTAGDVNGDGYSDVIVGAPYYDNGETDEGRAYVYHGSAGGLAVSAAWTAESNQDMAQFGYSVGTAGDVNGDGYSDVIVGAPYYFNGENLDGVAYVYYGSEGGLAVSAGWTGENHQQGAQFGYSVGTAGDVNGDGYSDVIVGAPFYDSGQGPRGRVFVYYGSAGGLSASPAWTAESDQVYSQFGYSVSTAGDVNGDGYSDVIAGAWLYANGEAKEGRAYVYYGSAGGLAVNPSWTAESNQAKAGFGLSVSTAGDVNGDGYSDVIIGAPYYDNGETDEGRAHVYYGSASGLGVSAGWSAESNQAYVNFGYSVNTAGDVNGDGYSDVIVGGLGRALVFHGSAGGLAVTAAWTAESDQVGTQFGYSVGTAGDVNGDGYSDAIVGAPYYDNGETDEGRAYVYYGSAGGLAVTAAWTAESDQVGAQFGYSVGIAGDVNGDGYPDVIVGAPYHDNGETDEGRAYVFHGSAAGLALSAAWTAENDQAYSRFGYSVGTAGDVNGDGYSDVIVGAYWYDNGESDEGRAYVYHGSAVGLASSAAWTAESNQAIAWFGYSVGTAGDVNGDGYSDVIVGAYMYDNGQTNEGRAFVYHGSAVGLALSPAWTAESDQANAWFGYSVGTAGDVNGDGYSDVILGSLLYTNGQGGEGRSFVFHGSAGGLASSAAWTAESNQDMAQFGYSVGTAGDVNGDGYSDVIVGARYYDNGQTDEGRAYAYYGSVSGLAVSAGWTAESNQADAYFGRSVGTAGDVNGDGYSDVIVGAPYYDNGQTDEGRASVYYGNEGGGLQRMARQARTDDSAPIAPLGLSDSYDGFLLKVVGRTPLGRGNVRLQYEVKPLGTAFNGSGLVTGSAHNTGVPGGDGSVVNLSGLVSGLTPNTLYHWRVRTLTDSPFFPRSQWFSMWGNSVTEADVRTGNNYVGVEGNESVPGVQLLGRGVPNPFEALTRLKYTLPGPGHVRLVVYDVAGRQVAVLRDGDEEAGLHVVKWDGKGARGTLLPAGVYFVQLNFGSHKEARKIVLTP